MKYHKQWTTYLFLLLIALQSVAFGLGSEFTSYAAAHKEDAEAEDHSLRSGINKSSRKQAGKNSSRSPRAKERELGDKKTKKDTTFPTAGPSSMPSRVKSDEPSAGPSDEPSISIPSSVPSSLPSFAPSVKPSSLPSLDPSSLPSVGPSETPSSLPSSGPSDVPSATPSADPSSVPSARPSSAPSLSAVPSAEPSGIPSTGPSNLPSNLPSLSPSLEPSFLPSSSPSKEVTSLMLGETGGVATTFLDSTRAVDGGQPFSEAGRGATTYCGTNISALVRYYRIDGRDQTVVTATIANSEFDAKMSVFAGNFANCIGGVDDSPYIQETKPTLAFETASGETYLLLVHGFQSQTGRFQLEVATHMIPAPEALSWWKEGEKKSATVTASGESIILV